MTLAGLWSCRKDIVSFEPAPSTLEEIQNLLGQVPSASAQTTFVLSGFVPDTVLITPGGVRVFLTDTEQLFEDADGNLVPCSTCQALRIEITEVLKKGDMIAYGIPTTTTENELLESGGIVKVVVTCDGKPLRLLPDRNLKIQIPATDPADNMLIYSAQMQHDTFAGWVDTGLPVFQAEWPNPNGGDKITGYELFSPALDWLNYARPVNEQSTSFCVGLPAGFNPENTTAYLVFKNMRSVAAMEIDLANQTFCYKNAPHGFQVKIVTVSKIENGQYWLGNLETEIGTNATLNISPLEVDESQMLNFLKSL